MHEDRIRQEQYRIADTDWDRGWRYGLREAIDKALEAYPDGTELKIEAIYVKKRGDTSFHDYLITVGTP
jgi:hypothetical protein